MTFSVFLLMLVPSFAFISFFGDGVLIHSFKKAVGLGFTLVLFQVPEKVKKRKSVNVIGRFSLFASSFLFTTDLSGL